MNYLENMRLGIDAVGAAGGIIEGAVCYTGDLMDPERTQYDLDYYLEFTRQLVGCGIHVLCIKDMAGLLKPGVCVCVCVCAHQQSALTCLRVILTHTYTPYRCG